jgi:putative holliday junction resolvase
VTESVAPREAVRWLGVDPGEARVGLAACDPEERVAVPLEVVPASAAFPAIRAIAQREGIGGIVLGLAVSMDGVEREQAALARKLGDRLERSLGLPLIYEDERLSSAAAERTRLDPRDRKPRDDIAAALLLQQFIDRRRAQREREAAGAGS